MNDEYKQYIDELSVIKNFNFDALDIASNYLINSPAFIKKDMVEELAKETESTNLEAFKILFTTICGIDIVDNQRDKYLYEHYFQDSIIELNPAEFSKDPYYSNIKFPEESLANWTFTNKSYQPYEMIVYDDIKLEKDFTEIPRIGYFADEFRYPCAMENDNEWMMVTPEETQTMKASLQKAHGNVITFGLGLGYYPYIASLKSNVKTMTIVEKSPVVIEMFQKYLLPQYPNKEKIKIIESDGFQYMKDEMPKQNYDYAFVDMWHDVSDGLEMYVKTKGLELYNPKLEFDYWIEDSIISQLRWFLFDCITGDEKTEIPLDGSILNDVNALKKFLSTEELKKFAVILSGFVNN